LRQEFRELELLDEISKLSMKANFRSHSRQLQKPIESEHIRSGRVQICTSTNSSCFAMVCQRPTALLSVVTDAPWQIIDKKKEERS